MKKTIIASALCLAFVFGMAVPTQNAYADSAVVELPNPLDPSQNKNPKAPARSVKAITKSNKKVVFGTIQKVIEAVLGIVGSVALLIIVYGGFLWLTSAGNASQVDKGKRTLAWAGVGLAVVFGSAILVDLVIKALQKGGG